MSLFLRTTFVLFFGSAAVFAQTSQINGVVRDSAGLSIPGAAIKATQTATGVVRADHYRRGRRLRADEFSHRSVSGGSHQGRLQQVRADRHRAAGRHQPHGRRQPCRSAAVSEQVTVEAGAVQVETRTTSIGQVVDSQRVLEMPLNGRDVHELIFLAGMANYPGTASLNTVRNYPTVVVSVAGGLPDSVSYTLDGVIHQDPYNNLSLPLPFPDALQEFKVETSAIPGAVRLSFDRDRECRHQVRHQPVSRRSVRVPAQRRPERPRLLRGEARYVEAQPVRRHDRRADPQGQAVLLRRLSAHHRCVPMRRSSRRSSPPRR